MNERMETTLTTSQFFDMLKNQKLYSLKQEVMDTLINELKTNRIKADNIGQTILSQKLDFLIDVTEKEKVLFEKGFTEFIWHKDLTRYITSVTPNAPVILDLEYYERIIPDANMEDILAAKNLGIFDRLLIVFNKPKDELPANIEEVKKERERLRDPIVFGAFEGTLVLKKRKTNSAKATMSIEKSDVVIDEISEKLYYITSWDDENCDLTLQKLMEVINSDSFRKIEPDIPLAEIITKGE